MTLGLFAPTRAQAATVTTTPYATKITMTASPIVVHTGTWTKFTGHAYYLSGTTWKPVYRGTIQLRYRLAGTTTWHRRRRDCSVW